LKEQLARVDADWGSCLSGAKPWNPELESKSLIWTARLSLDVGSERWRGSGSASAGALLMCEHEKRSQVFVATLMDTFRRLGCAPVKGYSEGFGDWSQAFSALPPKRHAIKHGFAYCIEIASGEIIATRMGRKAANALAALPLWKAYGQWHGMSLLGSNKEIKKVAGLGRPNRSYSACALPGLKTYPYPCQLIVARGDWRGSKGADANEACEALRSFFGKNIEEIEILGVSGEELGAMRPAALENWLDGVKANLQARDLERAVAKIGEEPSNAGGGKNKPRL
jgi:hypothetical protein